MTRTLCTFLFIFLSCNNLFAQEYFTFVTDKNFPKQTLPSYKVEQSRHLIQKHYRLSSGIQSFKVKFKACSNSPLKSADFYILNGRNEKVFIQIISANECLTKTTPQIIGNKFTISSEILHKDASYFSLEVISLFVQNLEIEPKSYQDPDNPNIEDLGIEDYAYKFSRGVAILTIESQSGISTCTGFLVRKNLILTNNHCVSKKEINCESIHINFDFYADSKKSAVENDLCKTIVKEGNYYLDWAAIELSRDIVDRYIFNKSVQISEISTGEPLLIIHHPSGQPKKVSKIGCKIHEIPIKGKEWEGKNIGYKSAFSHTCDTTFGSSGSPILDKEGRLVGLHFAGFGVLPQLTGKYNRATIAEFVINELEKY